jgi:hypothetical protein
MKRRALSLMVATCVVAAATAACSGGDDEAQRQSGSPTSSIEVDGAVTGEVTARERQDVAGPPVDVEGAEAITLVVEVATDGEVSGEVEIRIPTTAAPTEEQIVFALAAETPEGPWELLPAQVEGGTVVVTTTHFSLFQAFKVLVGEVVDVARQTFDGLTSGVVAEAEPPTCEDEAGARMDGFNVGSDSTDTVYWCFGRDAEGRMVRMVNNRRYALLLSHSDGLVMTDQSSAGAVAWVSQLLTLDHQVAVAPRESVTFRVDLLAGGSASAVTESTVSVGRSRRSTLA